MKTLVVVALFVISCGPDGPIEEQEILFSYPELSAMTIGQTHPFMVSLNLPANGGEMLTAGAPTKSIYIWPETQDFKQGETIKFFNLTAKTAGKVSIKFALHRFLSKELDVWIFPEP